MSITRRDLFVGTAAVAATAKLAQRRRAPRDDAERRALAAVQAWTPAARRSSTSAPRRSSTRSRPA